MNRFTLFGLGFATLTGCVDAFEGQWYNPTPLDAYTFPNNRVPIEQIEQVELQSSDPDGAVWTIWGVWAHRCAAPPCLSDEDIQNTIVYFHGNASNLDGYWPRIQMLWDLGLSVFAIDYRGYGRSEGTPSEAGIYADARVAYQHVVERLGVAPMVYGFSLGSAPAVQIATEHRLAGLILEAPFASGQGFVDDAVGVGLPRSVVMDTDFGNVDKIPDVVAPKLIMHGRDDDFVRFEFGQVLYERAQEPKEFYWVEGAGHSTVPCPGVTDGICEANMGYQEALNRFLDGQ